MNLLERSKAISFRENPPSEEELKSLYIPPRYKNISEQITKIEGTFYYFKETLEFSLINELIGSYLSKKIDLDTVDYEIGQKESDGTLFALSKIFYEEGYQYQSASEFLKRHHYRNCFLLPETRFLTKLPVYYNMRTLKLYRGTRFYTSNLKLIAVDLKMAQYDRHSRNLQIKIDSKGTIDLAPLYDYGGSYLAFLTKDYVNPFVYIKKDKDTLEWLFTFYPELWEYVQFLQGISITDVLDSIAQEKGIEFTNVEYSSYRELQQANDEVMSKVKIKTIF